MSRNDFRYKKMLFIGGGNIAGAVACGLVDSNSIPAEYITVYDINASQLDKFRSKGIKTTIDLVDALDGAEIVFLAVKPAIVSTVMKQIKDTGKCNDNNVLFVSFAAAVTIQHITEAYGDNIQVIRTMPSTPILVGEGVLAVSKNDLVSSKSFEYFCRMMSSIAHVTVIEESLMNPIISVHGSSPAYVYLFVKAMLDSAVNQGVPPESALPLILKTIKGSITMIEKSDSSIETLISNVASPNGTTLAALNSFENDDFCGAVDRAMTACTKRADEISKEL